MILGIDASNLRAGGGITHLVEVLQNVDPSDYGFSKVIVWAGSDTTSMLKTLPPRFDVRALKVLDANVAFRFLWQQFGLSKLARECDLLFNPGCGYVGSFRPYVTMSRNMLMFDKDERRRYGFSAYAFRCWLLSWTHRFSISRAAGTIFLSDHASSVIQKTVRPIRGKVTRVAHGVSRKYFKEPRPQRPIESYDMGSPFRLVYVSTIDEYKNHPAVVEAVAALRRRGVPVTLSIIGWKLAAAFRELQRAMDRVDPKREFTFVLGPKYGDDLLRAYHEADGFVFASSCENLPNILLEAMASGLPIACSQTQPMPEILADAGVYFDPKNSDGISRAIQQLVSSTDLRSTMAEKAFRRAQSYSWPECAERTFSFLKEVVGSEV